MVFHIAEPDQNCHIKAGAKKRSLLYILYMVVVQMMTSIKTAALRQMLHKLSPRPRKSTALNFAWRFSTSCMAQLLFAKIRKEDM